MGIVKTTICCGLRVEKEMARWQFGRMFHDALKDTPSWDTSSREYTINELIIIYRIVFYLPR